MIIHDHHWIVRQTAVTEEAVTSSWFTKPTGKRLLPTVRDDLLLLSSREEIISMVLFICSSRCLLALFIVIPTRLFADNEECEARAELHQRLKKRKWRMSTVTQSLTRIGEGARARRRGRAETKRMRRGDVNMTWQVGAVRSFLD